MQHSEGWGARILLFEVQKQQLERFWRLFLFTTTRQWALELSSADKARLGATTMTLSKTLSTHQRCRERNEKT
jgi:hypothetical protein